MTSGACASVQSMLPMGARRGNCNSYEHHCKCPRQHTSHRHPGPWERGWRPRPSGIGGSPEGKAGLTPDNEPERHTVHQREKATRVAERTRDRARHRSRQDTRASENRGELPHGARLRNPPPADAASFAAGPARSGPETAAPLSARPPHVAWGSRPEQPSGEKKE